MQQAAGKLKVGLGQALGLVLPYAGRRLLEQVRSVWLIIAYLFVFLWLVLKMPVDNAAAIAAGLVLVITGLTFFMEGLILGLMPLGEAIGLRLPRKRGLGVILGFAFLLGMGATFAEPAIGVLKAAGSSVEAWRSPLLFLLLNRYAGHLVWAVGAGVGIAVACGMVRFMYQLSLKPFIYTLVGGLTILTIYCTLDPGLRHVVGLAWDCGAVTTGPVTVPLVLALGIGICRVVGKGGSAGGFGVVTLASLFPILTVLLLGVFLGSSIPKPVGEAEFFRLENRQQALALFDSETRMRAYAFKNAHSDNHALLFDGGQGEMLAYLAHVAADPDLQREIFGDDPEAIFRWAATKGSYEQRLAVFGDPETLGQMTLLFSGLAPRPGTGRMAVGGALAAVQAIVPLTLFLFAVLIFIVRERLPRTDEIIAGIAFALLGMGLFNIGIEMGLARLGNQVGGKLPALFQSISLTESQRTIFNFDKSLVQTAMTPDGDRQSFFHVKTKYGYEAVPFSESGYNPETRSYTYIPVSEPLFGGGYGGLAVLLAFAFLMGYGATLAEPALNALGRTVEEMTVGTFRKTLLMQAVAGGVGVGIALGVAKIVWSLPLAWLLIPPYLLLLVMTALSTEEFVNIAWDSAGVTTGPVTVPLVLAIGLGIGSQVGVVEGFGILAMASVCPIVSVLAVGLSVTRARKAALTDAKAQAVQGGGA